MFSVLIVNYCKSLLLTDRFVKIPVPHVVYGASGSAHNECSEPKETDVVQVFRDGRVRRVGRHRYRPRCPRPVSSGFRVPEDKAYHMDRKAAKSR